jgi:hypothetical protein
VVLVAILLVVGVAVWCWLLVRVADGGPARRPGRHGPACVTPGQATTELGRARRRLDDGTITPAEFEAIRAEVRG